MLKVRMSFLCIIRLQLLWRKQSELWSWETWLHHGKASWESHLASPRLTFLTLKLKGWGASCFLSPGLGSRRECKFLGSVPKESHLEV